MAATLISVGAVAAAVVAFWTVLLPLLAILLVPLLIVRTSRVAGPGPSAA